MCSTLSSVQSVVVRPLSLPTFAPSALVNQTSVSFRLERLPSSPLFLVVYYLLLSCSSKALTSMRRCVGDTTFGDHGSSAARKSRLVSQHLATMAALSCANCSPKPIERAKQTIHFDFVMFHHVFVAYSGLSSCFTSRLALLSRISPSSTVLLWFSLLFVDVPPPKDLGFALRTVCQAFRRCRRGPRTPQAVGCRRC